MEQDTSDQLSLEKKTLTLTKRIEELEQKAIENNFLLLKQIEINQVKTRFVSIASHEFRTPLTSIQLSADLIERYYDRLDKEKIVTHLRKIKMAVSDLTSILNDFLSIEKIESGIADPVWREFNLQVLAQDLVDEMSGLMKPGQDISYTHLGNQTHVSSDKTLLKRCMTNLLSNAIKYSGENKPIRLHTEIIDNCFTIKVTDEGIGIPEDALELIFEPFFRAKNTYDIQGTGLGLNIVKRYTELLNGKVTLVSTIAGGTTFCLSFPVKSEQKNPFFFRSNRI